MLAYSHILPSMHCRSDLYDKLGAGTSSELLAGWLTLATRKPAFMGLILFRAGGGENTVASLGVEDFGSAAKCSCRWSVNTYTL